MAGRATLKTYQALGDPEPETFLQQLLEQKQTFESFSPTEQWLIDLLIYETKNGIRKKQNAETELSKIKTEVANSEIKLMQNTPDEQYGDFYNRIVCTTLDKLEQENAVPPNIPGLKYSDQLVRNQILETVDINKIEQFYTKRFIYEKQKKLSDYLQSTLAKTNTVDQALNMAGLLFEIDERKTDNIWNSRNRNFYEILMNGFNGEKITFVTMLCLMNDFDNNGNYTSISDIFLYKERQKLKPIPLLLDEMYSVIKLFDWYGIQSDLQLYIADTDYTETDRYGAVNETNIENIKAYTENVKQYCQSLSSKIYVAPFSDISGGNTSYIKCKEKVLQQVSTFNDNNFERKWYKKFEEAVEKIAESQRKKKLYPLKDIRKKSLEITRKIWACNAAEGMVISSLGKNVIFISSESRERDQNYVIDCEKDFPPVMYVLKSTEKWYKERLATINN